METKRQIGRWHEKLKGLLEGMCNKKGKGVKEDVKKDRK